MPIADRVNVCVVIPAYKPGRELVETVKACIGLPRPEDKFRFIIVDDGSGEEYASVFEQAAAYPAVTVLRHAVNRGKGAALKTAFNHVLLSEDCAGVVTADADGQHLPKDILAVSRLLTERGGALVLGCRSFGGKVPWRSRIGNSLTAFVTRLLLGKAVRDTQTGLRGIPKTALGDFLRLAPNGYDFEMEMLVAAITKKMPVIQVPIETVYLDNNKHSHFNPLRDSLAIYAVFIKHIGNALASSFMDYVVFSIALYTGKSLGVSLVCGRIFAGLFNFLVAKKIVFKSKSAFIKEFFYMCLWSVSLLLFLTALSTYCCLYTFRFWPRKL
jgi:glycosyltransferase involved in cell wall biosynthesis